MFEFAKLCRSVEKMSHETRTKVLRLKSERILNDLIEISDSRETADRIFLEFVLNAIAADGAIKRSEYEYLRPVFEVSAGRKVEFDEAKKILHDAKLDLPNAYLCNEETLKTQMGGLPLEIRSDMAVLCLIVCSIDGVLSFKERKLIRKLCDFR